MVNGWDCWLCLFFFLSDSRIVSHLLFAYNWKTRFWDIEPIVTRFSSNTCGTSNIRIPRNSTELHLAPCMCVVCRVRGLGPNHTSKQNVLSLFLLIPIAELMNQKKGICRLLILYHLWLRPPFPNDSSTLRPKVGLRPNLMKIDFRKYLWKI